MYYVIANPAAGRKKKNHSYQQIIQILDEKQVPYTLFETQKYEDPLRIAIELSKKQINGGNLIIIGGDGTINEVINGLDNLLKWNIGIIPTGSGNDIASKLNIPLKDPIQALEIILSHKPSLTDYIQVNDMKCINIAGSGIDIDVILRFEKYKRLKGSFRYFWALIVTIFRFKWYEFEISVDDEPFLKHKGFITAACNGSQYGGGIRICPDSIMNDGYMDYVFAQKINRLTIPYYLIQLMRGKINKYKFYHHQLCKKIVYHSQQDFYLNVDGKLIKNNHFECKIVPNGINFYR